MSVFEDIKTGLLEAIEYEKGNLKAKTTKMTVTPLNTFEPKEIRQIRLNAGMTQTTFAQCIGVSVKTIEAWEGGRNHPDGAACRLLALTQLDPNFLHKAGIVAAQ